MTDRVTGRHRASHRASTPLSVITTGLTTAVTGRLESLGRGSAVLAVSSGLVASIALPATAATGQERDAGPQTASQPAAGTLTAADLVASADLLGSRQGTGASAPLTAPAGASVQFEQGGVRASDASASTRVAPHVSRAAARSAAAAKAAAAAAKAATSTGSASSSSSDAGTIGGTSARGSAVLAIAARYVGIPYRSGGTTPGGFDCSGYVQYVFKLLGFSLPRTADEQMHATRRISASQAMPGDLVFFVSNGVATHVGIVAGDGYMYDSPHTGLSVSKRKIYSANVVYGRVVA